MLHYSTFVLGYIEGCISNNKSVERWAFGQDQKSFHNNHLTYVHINGQVLGCIYVILCIKCNWISGIFIVERFHFSICGTFRSWGYLFRRAWWRHERIYFPRYRPFVRGIHRSPMNSPHKGQWRGALIFSLICAWINRWVNNGEAGDLRRYRAHHDVIVMRLTVIRASLSNCMNRFV